MIIDKIVNLFESAANMLTLDYVMYGCLGLATLTFLLMILCTNYAMRFKKAVKSAAADLKKNPRDVKTLNSAMERFPSNVSQKWKLYLESRRGVSPAGFIDQNTCVDAPIGKKGARRTQIFGFLILFITLLAVILNQLVTADSNIFSPKNLTTPLLTVLAGIIFIALLFIAFQVRYNKTLKEYYELVKLINKCAPSASRVEEEPSPALLTSADGEEGEQETESQQEPPTVDENLVIIGNEPLSKEPPMSKKAEPIYVREPVITRRPIVTDPPKEEAQPKSAPKSEPQPKSPPPNQNASGIGYRGPVTSLNNNKSTGYRGPITNLDNNKSTGYRGPITNLDNNPPKAAAPSSTDPRREDVAETIDRITSEGANKQTLLDVAKLLQAERAKADNSPERKQRLDNALSKLLRAISAANK